MTLAPCPSCSRHVRHGDAVCPFCASPALARRIATGVVAGAAMLALGVAGCEGGRESPAVAPAPSGVKGRGAPAGDPAPLPAASSGQGGGGAPSEGTSLRGKVDVLPPRIAGTLAGDPSAAKKVLATRPALQRCYERALRENPVVQGEVTFRIQIDDSGATGGVTSTNASSVPTSATSCMAARLGAITFGAGGASTVEVTVRCRPGE